MVNWLMAVLIIFEFLELVVIGLLLFYVIQLQKQFEEFETDMSMILFDELEDFENGEN